MLDLKQIFIKIFCLLTVLSVLNQPCNGADSVNLLNSDMYNLISSLEKQVYNKDYDKENFYTRLDRLEKTVLKTVYTDSINNRLNRIQNNLSISKEAKQQDNRQIILDLLEIRYFGFNYKNDSMESRLGRLEECLFGKIIIGSTDFRFENLAKQMPASNKQVLMQTENNLTEGKDKNWKEYISFADINLNDSELDYFANIQKYDSNKILRWENFPILVYIYPESENLIKIAKKAVQIWGEYIQVSTTDNAAEANIVISWKKNYTSITKSDQPEHVLYSRDNKTKIFVYCGRYKDTTYFDKFLTHQIGHSLGIWGHSKDKNDIMYSFKEFKNDINYKDIGNDITDVSVNLAPYMPTTRDINTLIKIYHIKSK